MVGVFGVSGIGSSFLQAANSAAMIRIEIIELVIFIVVSLMFTELETSFEIPKLDGVGIASGAFCES